MAVTARMVWPNDKLIVDEKLTIGAAPVKLTKAQEQTVRDLATARKLRMVFEDETQAAGTGDGEKAANQEGQG